MLSKKGLVVITVLSLLVFSSQIVGSENIEYQNEVDGQAKEQIGENYILTWRHHYRNQIQEGVQNESVVMECNISKQAGKLYINSYEYQKGLTLEIKEQNQYKLQIKVSAEYHEGKVLVLNIEKNAFQFKKSNQIKVKFDGKEINEANIDDVIDGQGTEAQFTSVIGEEGGQYIVYIPHFSDHIITFEIIGVTESEAVTFITAAIGAAFLTIFILILIIVKMGKFKSD
ncbi:hypothetical protein [[Eubacterium] cellulosolvens]